MLYKIVSWIRSPCSEVGIVWRDARGILAALGEHPLVASSGQVRGRGVSGRVESGRWEREGERTGCGLHVPLPVRDHAGEACDSPVRVEGGERWEGALYRRLEGPRSPGTSPE